MRGFRYLAAATAITGLLAGSAATAASAATAQPAGTRAAAGVHLRGGATAVTTSPGIASALLKNGIVPCDPAGKPVGAVPQERPGCSVRVSGNRGRVTLNPLGGKIRHRGGILFLNLKNGKKIEVSRFTINLTRADLTGIVNGDPKVRVPLFRLDLSHAKLAAGKHVVTASGIGLKLTSAAAKALNAALGTKLFSAGLELGTARTLLRL